MIGCIKNILKFTIGKINFNKKIIINNKRFIIPVIHNVGFGNLRQKDGFWMIQLIKIINKINNGIFIDIGANVGQTLLQVKSCFDNISYIGFEPNPVCAGYIKQLIRKNSFSDCIIVSSGISFENAILNLHTLTDADSGATIIEDLRPKYSYKDRFSVPVFDFSTVLKHFNINKIGIIKIDVEGAEHNVMMSIAPYLDKFRPVIICEILWAYNNECLENFKIKNKELASLLKNSSYDIYQIIKSTDLNSIKDLKKVSEINNIVFNNENANLCDYLFIHSEKSTMLTKFMLV